MMKGIFVEIRGAIGLVLLLWGWSLQSHALEIVITSSNEAAFPIAVVPFKRDGSGLDPSGIVANDLRLSGEFAPLAASEMLSRPHDFQSVNFMDWKLMEIPTLVVGKVKPHEVEFQLVDVYQRKAKKYRFPLKRGDVREMRTVAHAISDLIYEKLIGVKGIFHTRLAYISMTKDSLGRKVYTLEITDFDGENTKVLLTSRYPLLSPNWSPDGRKLAYVSFENGKSEVWIQNIYTGERRKIASFKGKNSAPAWSPDGKKLALSLSRDGNSEIYLFTLKNRKLKRLTRSRGVDTEPEFSADGKEIVFLSDRSRYPQVYRKQMSGGTAKRLTFTGKYNTSPDWSPDGKKIAFLHGEGNRYRIAMLHLDSGVMEIMTDNQLDESPSFSANGRMVAYATEQDGQGVLEIVSVEGGGVQRLSLPGKNVREPVWSPFLK